MKIYTGGGDFGKTSLLSGESVYKNHPQIEACGDLDELNSIVGGIKSLLPPTSRNISEELHGIQSSLITIGAYISTSKEASVSRNVPKISQSDIERLETAIDAMQAELPSIKGFILPNGHISAVMAHIARTVCRRAERRVAGLSQDIDGCEKWTHLQYPMIYLNRMSDYFFVLARYCNHAAGVAEDFWKG